MSSSAPVPEFTHNAFRTRDFDRCIAFYEQFAALRSVKLRGDDGERVAWLAPGAADAPIFVFIETSERVPAEESLGRHLGFELPTRESIDALRARIAAAGLDPTEAQYIDEIVGYIFMVRDPDGRVVEFNYGQDVSPANWD